MIYEPLKREWTLFILTLSNMGYVEQTYRGNEFSIQWVHRGCRAIRKCDLISYAYHECDWVRWWRPDERLEPCHAAHCCDIQPACEEVNVTEQLAPLVTERAQTERDANADAVMKMQDAPVKLDGSGGAASRLKRRWFFCCSHHAAYICLHNLFPLCFSSGRINYRATCPGRYAAERKSHRETR